MFINNQNARKIGGRYAYLSGTWMMKMAKPKVEGTPTVGLILKNEVCTGGILLYQFTNFLYLAQSCGWVQKKHC